MADVAILYWQEIPSLVEDKDDGGSHKIQLGDGFQALIDQAAMVRGLAGTDAYLEAWSRGEPETRDDSAEAMAKAVAGELEARFGAIKTAALKKKD